MFLTPTVGADDGTWDGSTHRRMTTRAWLDVVLFVLVLAVAGWWGARFVRAAGRPPAMYNDLFEPAVMMTCGRGFHLSVAPPAALNRFLSTADDHFSCSTLSADLKLQPGQPPQGSWLYLMLAVAASWRVFGISWTGLAPLLGLFFGLSSACAYALFRFGMGRVASLLCAGAFTVSTLQLLSLPSFRDYAKAPIMIALVAIALALVFRRLRPRGVIALCAVYGSLVGLGYGLKPDTLIQLPVLALTVLVFVPGHLTSTLTTRLFALTAAAAAVTLTMWPVVRATPATGNNLWHVALIGFMPEYDSGLGVGNPVYRWGITGSDEYVVAASTNYVERIHPDWPEPVMYTYAYERATRSYLLEFIRRFPADVVTRAVASAARMPEVPFGWPQPPLPGFADSLYAARARLLAPLYGWVLPLTLAAIVGIALVRPIHGLFLAFLFAYIGSYPAIQFHNRNFFYLEVVGWLTLGFVASQIARAIATRRSPFAEITPAQLRRRMAAVTVLVMAGAAILLALRTVQAREVRRTVGGYLRAPVTTLTLDRGDREGVHTARVAAFAAESADPRWARMMRVDLDAAACKGGTLLYRYDPSSSLRGFSQSIDLPAAPSSSGRMTVFEPVYSGFTSIELRRAGGGCVVAVSRVTGLDQEPLWMPLVLDANWRDKPLYQWLQTRENIH